MISRDSASGRLFLLKLGIGLPASRRPAVEDVEVSFSKHGRLSYGRFQHSLDTAHRIKPAAPGLHLTAAFIRQLPAWACPPVKGHRCLTFLLFYRSKEHITDKTSEQTNKVQNTRLTLPDAPAGRPGSRQPVKDAHAYQTEY